MRPVQEIEGTISADWQGRAFLEDPSKGRNREGKKIESFYYIKMRNFL